MKNLAHMTNYKTMGLTYNWTILLDKKKRREKKKHPQTENTLNSSLLWIYVKRGDRKGKLWKLFFSVCIILDS